MSWEQINIINHISTIQ